MPDGTQASLHSLFYVFNPVVSWIVYSGCPGIPWKVADHPAVIHGESGCGCLGVGLSSWNLRAASVLNLKCLFADKAGSKALWPFVTIVIYLWLGMLVGGIAGPAALMGNYLSIYHIGIRSIAVVKDGADRTLHFIFP